MERIKNEEDDFVIDGPLTIKELYELALKEGFEDRELFFSIRFEDRTKIGCSTSHVVSFGKGWTKRTSIVNLRINKMPDDDIGNINGGS